MSHTGQTDKRVEPIINDPTQKKIRIFVSHRIDLDCNTIQNPIYKPIRCGAVFDTRPDVAMAGDDIGDNISEKRLTFNEFTVQYWAWKNYDADYYGLCHYRRYFSFRDKQFPEKRFNVYEPGEISDVAGKYALQDSQRISQTVCSCDAIVPEAKDVRSILAGAESQRYYVQNVREFWLSKTDQFQPEAMKILTDTVRELRPDFYPALEEYLDGTEIVANLCYIMKRNMFTRFCELVFPLIFELETRLNPLQYDDDRVRLPAFCGEIIFGAFIRAQKKEGAVIRERQLILFTQCNAGKTANNFASKYLNVSDKNIAVFVSHRIDIESRTIDCPIYWPVRCGAAYDVRESIDLPGDNTGENISEKRMSYGELTVQYWAWKNYDADYYGLCHYRRYLSYSEQEYPTDDYAVILEKQLSDETIAKYRINDEKKIRRIVKSYDAVVGKGFDTRKITRLEPQNCVWDIWKLSTKMIDSKAIDYAVEYVQKNFPDYYESLLGYLNSPYYRGYNCFVMKKELFFELCRFQYGVMFGVEKTIDASLLTGGEKRGRTLGYIGEIMYGAYIYHLQKTGKYRIREQQIVFFYKTEKSIEQFTPSNEITNSIKTEKIVSSNQPQKQSNGNKNVSKVRSMLEKIKQYIKRLMCKVLPSYRVGLRVEKRLKKIERFLYDGEPHNETPKHPPAKPAAPVLKKTPWERKTLTSRLDVMTSCLALEIHETHKETFSEFRCCHTGQDVVIVATGPSMKYYTQLPDRPHIGVNAAYKRSDIKLDYFFLTDYEACGNYLDDLKNYNFIKFFGQYSVGTYRDRFQVPEHFLMENHGRRFFQAAPGEDIPINIEYYPLMGFYSIAFQAIQFALYTNAKRIYLVGCDCTMEGYFDGSKNYGNLPKWAIGYKKLNAFVQRFYPNTEIISINPVGLKGLFRDVYTENYLKDHPEIDPTTCEILR